MDPVLQVPIDYPSKQPDTSVSVNPLSTPPLSRNNSSSPSKPHSPFQTPPFSASLSQSSSPLAFPEDALLNLSAARLDSIANHLWIAGRPQSNSLHKSPLHRLKATGFEFVVYEQADLHLLWGNGMIYIKPLPSYLLNYEFWRDELCDRGEGWDEGRSGLSSLTKEICNGYRTDSLQKSSQEP